ncbi:MAG: PAS domain S-box protein, partial [Burkholderiales bacterium]
MTGRRDVDLTEALREAALAVSTAQGEQVFEQLAAALARILGVEFALISVYVEPARTHFRTLAAYLGGRSASGFDYPVAGTPCEQAMSRSFGFFPKGVAKTFAGAAMLADQGVEGYAGTSLHDLDGRPIGVMVAMSTRAIEDRALFETVLNIFGARVSAEIGRRRMEASYRALFENAETAIFIHDIESGAIVDVNPKACETYGYGAEELKRLNLDELSSGEPPYTGAHARALIERARRGEVVRAEWHRRNKDGSLHWDDIMAKRIEISGRPHIIVAAREITERKSAEEAMRASEEQYRAIFNASTDSLTLRDADFRIVDVNAAYERMSGLTRDQALGASELTVDLLDVADWRHAVHDRAIAGEAVRIESEARRRDGERVRLEVLVLPMQYRGAPHALYVARDITDRQRAEAALRASEEQYREIFNATDDALVLRDAQFRIVDVNAAYEAMSGRRREEVVGMTELTLTRNTVVADRQGLHEAALAGQPVTFESDGRRLDGSPLVLEVRGVPMTYRGEPHVLYIGQDVTEKKLAERALRASEEQYRAIFNAAADGLVLRDADYRVVDVNSAYEPMSGLKREEMIGTTEALMYAAGERDGLRLEIHRRALAGERLNAEIDAVRRDGARFRMDLQVVPMQYRGKPHVLYIGRDITERTRAEAERAELEAQLRQAQKMEAIGHLAGGIAHDFNNILLVIRGHGAVLLDKLE